MDSLHDKRSGRPAQRRFSGPSRLVAGVGTPVVAGVGAGAPGARPRGSVAAAMSTTPSNGPVRVTSLSPWRRVLFLFVLGALVLPIALVAEISYRIRREVPLFPAGPRSSASADGVSAMDFDDVHYYEIFERVSDPDLLYLPRPDFARGAVRINSHGFRDREFPVAKPPGTFRIVVLGDSIVWGHRLPLEDTFAKQLEGLLNARPGPGPTYEVLNFGVSGYSARQEVGIFRARAAAFQPDLVIVGFCVNDEYYSSVEGDFLDGGSGSLFRRWFLFEHAELSLLELTRRHFPALASRFRSTVDVRKHLADLASLRGGARSLIVIFPVLESLDAYRDGGSHRRLADAAAGLPFVVHDLLPDFRGRPDLAYRVDPRDVIHPNRLGNEVAARAALTALVENGFVPRAGE